MAVAVRLYSGHDVGVHSKKLWSHTEITQGSVTLPFSWDLQPGLGKWLCFWLTEDRCSEKCCRFLSGAEEPRDFAPSCSSSFLTVGYFVGAGAYQLANRNDSRNL